MGPSRALWVDSMKDLEEAMLYLSANYPRRPDVECDAIEHMAFKEVAAAFDVAFYVLQKANSDLDRLIDEYL